MSIFFVLWLVHILLKIFIEFNTWKHLHIKKELVNELFRGKDRMWCWVRLLRCVFPSFSLSTFERAIFYGDTILYSRIFMYILVNTTNTDGSASTKQIEKGTFYTNKNSMVDVITFAHAIFPSALAQSVQCVGSHSVERFRFSKSILLSERINNFFFVIS